MKKIIVAITGASGVIYGIRLLQVLQESKIETHLVVSEAGERNIAIETDYSPDAVYALASVRHRNDDIAAPIASGSFRTDGMVVVPCTIKTLSAIAHSYGETLVVRAADVALKERRKLVLVVRETPLHKGHLELMHKAADLGAVILPPMPAFYQRPQTVADIVDHTVGKILDIFEIEHALFRRWGGALP
jgi:4-hydroxy-3-polyprenylbenzoate decarboxylase